MKLPFSRLCAWLVAALVTGVLASLVQTHLSLTALTRLGANIPASLWLRTLGEDVLRFAPVMMAAAAGALLPALLVARAATGRWRGAWTALTAATALGTVFWLMISVIPMPPIAGLRTVGGLLAMASSGLVGGAVYAVLTRVRAQGSGMPAAGYAGPRGDLARPVNEGGGPTAGPQPHPPRQAGAAARLAGSAHRRGVWASAGLVLLPVAVFLLTFPWPGPPPVDVDPQTYQVQTMASGLDRPWGLAVLPDGRMLVTEMGGRIRSVSPDGSLSDIAASGDLSVFQQRGVIGLMEVALDPEVADNGWVYLTLGYGEPGANGIRLVRARLQGDALVEPQEIYRTTPKALAGNNGGRLAFLPDGTILMTVGDGNLQREEAQNLANDLGSVVRIDRDGHAPPDNPFRARADADPALYSVGHRNAQGIAVDAATGQVWVTEHGPRGGDEVNRVEAGRNYGWPIVTGGIDYPFARVSPFERLDGYTSPSWEWTPSMAPAGLAIYDGDRFAGWQGNLLVPALRDRSLYRVIREDGRIVGQERLLSELGERLRDVRVAPDGALLVLTDGPEGRLLRITPR